MNKSIKVIASIIEKDNTYLIAQRPAHKWEGGLWEFPGGKTEPGETDQECLKRELFEEFNIQVEVGDYCCSHSFEYKDNTIELHAYHVTTFTGELQPTEHQDIRWVNVSELSDYKFPEPDYVIIDNIKKRGCDNS